MHTVANTFSTPDVKTVSNLLISREVFVKADPRDRGIYRRLIGAADLIQFTVVVKETDLLVLAESDLSDRVLDLVLTHRDRLERYIAAHPEFSASLAPVEVDATAPAIVREMADAGRLAGVGPMAAVAGAISVAVADGLGGASPNLIMENGGDLYLASTLERTVGIYGGEGEPRFGIRVVPGRTPIGICTSSGRIGHSLSLGDSSAATVLARSCALADAAATAVGNRVRGRGGVREGLRAAQGIPGVLGAVVMRGGELGVWGDVELVELGAP